VKAKIRGEYNRKAGVCAEKKLKMPHVLKWLF
jgi:hypothetical protein